MNVSEAETTKPRLRIVLSEYGKQTGKKLESNQEIREVTIQNKDGTISWAELELDKHHWTNEDDELAKKLRESKTGIEIDALLKGGLRIKASSSVGHVAFSNFDLVILPKFDNLTSEKESPLATLLGYAFDIGNLKIIGKQLSPSAYFAEILIHWLLEEARGIQRRGPFQQYRKEHKDLSIIRGKIDMNTWVRRGGISSGKLPC